MRYFIYSGLERVLSKLKGYPYVIDRGIPVPSLLGVLVRRSIWLLRGLLKTLLLQGRPRFVFMAPDVNLRNASLVEFGHGVTLERGVIIDGLSRQGIRLGDNVMIGAYTTVLAGMISSLGDGVYISRNSSCGPYSYIGAGGRITIGENVIMGQHVSFHAENHNFDRTDVPVRSQGVSRKGIVIDEDCWVGANAVFLDGCHVGRGCVVAAGAVVRGEFPPYSIIGGVPARVLRSRLPQESAIGSPAASGAQV
jgi:acetyltransferase-like isoleucine patch superfamily enzyme